MKSEALRHYLRGQEFANREKEISVEGDLFTLHPFKLNPEVLSLRGITVSIGVQGILQYQRGNTLKQIVVLAY